MTEDRKKIFKKAIIGRGENAVDVWRSTGIAAKTIRAIMNGHIPRKDTAEKLINYLKIDSVKAEHIYEMIEERREQLNIDMQKRVKKDPNSRLHRDLKRAPFSHAIKMGGKL